MGNPATGCKCGSGGHPRRCEVHPFTFDAHVAEINFEDALYDTAPDGTPEGHLVELRRLYEAYEKADRANLKHRCEQEHKLTEDRGYWRSRTHALEAERRALLLENGIDLGERPALDGERNQKRSQ